MTTTDLLQVQTAFQELRGCEEESVSVLWARMTAMQALVEHVDAEPWAGEWLRAELHAGMVLLSLLRTRRFDAEADPDAVTGDAQTAGTGRAVVRRRFDAWARTAIDRISSYLASDRRAEVLRPWQAQLQAFKDIRV